MWQAQPQRNRPKSNETMMAAPKTRTPQVTCPASRVFMLSDMTAGEME